MNTDRTRLAILWSLFFFLDLALSSCYYLGQWIEVDNYKKLLAELNTSYSPYLGVILIFYWTRREPPGATQPARDPRRKFAFELAFGCALLWNLLVFVLLARLAFHSGKVEESPERIADVRNMFSWLVAGSTGFFFGTNR